MPEPELTGRPLPISLIGMPGSGKSTIGRKLARRLGMPFADSDHEIERRLSCSIAECFARDGEERFRDVEADVLAELVDLPAAAVIATGGGIVLRPGNRRLLHERTRSFYLRASVDELGRRVSNNPRRPLLQGGDVLERLLTMDLERDPLYRQTAHHLVEMARPSVPGLVAMIVAQLP